MGAELTVAVVGAGYLGRFHAQKYRDMSDVKLIGVADVRASQAGRVAAEVGCDAFTGHQDLLGRVDAVSVAASTPAHFAISRDFLTHGADVMIEKPMTTTLDQADALIDLAQHNGRIIQVGHLERYNPVVKALAARVNDPRFIESHRLSIFQPRCTDVSVVLDLMIHDIDIISSFVRAPVEAVQAAGIAVITSFTDIANARLQFTNGCVANVTASRVALKSKRRLRLFQKNAYLSIDFADRSAKIIHRATGASTTDAPIPGVAIDEIQAPPGDALADELADFVDAVRSRRPPTVTGQIGRNALQIALAVMEQIHLSTDRINGRPS